MSAASAQNNRAPGADGRGPSNPPSERLVQLQDAKDRTRTTESTDDQDRDHGGVGGRTEVKRDENNRNGLPALFVLERPQKINDFLLLLSAQLIETFDDLICLTARAPMISDGLD